MKYFYALLIALAVLGAMLDEVAPPIEMPAVDIRAVEGKLGASLSGSALILRDQHRLFESDIQHYVSSHGGAVEGALIWADGAGEPAIVSAPGQDRLHHFSNSYLVGILPFATDNKWLPLYVLDNRKTYQLDSEQYGYPEIWQTSAEAFVKLRGDCEDHAIVLTDWLISLGVDARVVLGNHAGGGHAWVEAFQNDQAFLLEATDKRGHSAWRHYPLASLTRGYQPHFMFNRDTFWVNTGDPDTRAYQGEHWRISANFVPAI